MNKSLNHNSISFKAGCLEIHVQARDGLCYLQLQLYMHRTLAHARVTLLIVCFSQSVCQSVSYPRWPLQNGHNSETTSSITTKRGIGKGSIAFSAIILLKTLSTKCEAQGYGAIFTRKSGDKHVQTGVGNRVMNKYYMGDYDKGDYVQALHWQVTIE